MSTDLFKRAHKFYSKGNFRKAEDCCKLSIANDNNDYESYNLLGVMAIEAKKFGDAHGYLQKAVEINKEYSEGYSNLGSVYKANSLFSEAESCYRKVIDLNPHYASYFNFASLLQDKQKYNEAIRYYNLCLQYKPDCELAYCNIGVIFDKMGRPDEAIEFFKKALIINPNMDQACYNASYPILYTKGVAYWERFLDKYVEGVDLSNPKYVIILNDLAIAKWILGKVDECKGAVDAILPLIKQHTEQLEYMNMLRHVQAYSGFLRELIKWYADNDQDFILDGNRTNTLYFLGESHSITCANQFIKIGSNCYRGESKYILGCKIWHLIKEEQNQYKIAFNREIASIPENSFVVMAIGEIDSRCNEGVFKLYTHKQESWKQNTDYLILNYFEKVIALLKAKKLYPLIWGIPAPDTEPVQRIQKIYHNEYLSFIKYFNEQLQAYAKSYKVGFVDNYAITVSESGYAMDSKKMDSYHLRPDIFMNAVELCIFKTITSPAVQEHVG